MTIDIDTVQAWLAQRDHLAEEIQQGDRLAAVAAVLRATPAGESEVLLIERARHEADPWSGHMAFPGGRRDPEDEDLLRTALRETREEVGLDLERHGQLLGRLDDLAAVARGRRVGMIIAPFVFRLEGSPPLEANRREVETMLWAPLAPLARGEADTTHPYVIDGQPAALPGYDVAGKIVWGLTYRMLSGLLDDVLRFARSRR